MLMKTTMVCQRHYFYCKEKLDYSLLTQFEILVDSFFLLKICNRFLAMLSFMSYTPSYAIFMPYKYPKLCYSYAIYPAVVLFFFLNVLLQYITLTPNYANLSYAMFSGQSQGRISGYCCNSIYFS